MKLNEHVKDLKYDVQILLSRHLWIVLLVSSSYSATQEIRRIQGPRQDCQSLLMSRYRPVESQGQHPGLYTDAKAKEDIGECS